MSDPRHSLLRPMLPVLAAWLMTVASVAAGEAEEKRANLAEIAGAFRHLVADPLWEVKTYPVPKAVTKQAIAKAGELGLDPFRDAHVLRARLREDGSALTVSVYEFADDKAARKFIQFTRTSVEGAKAPEGSTPPIFEDGAGPSGALPGFRARRSLMGGKATHTASVQMFSRGPVVVMLAINDAAFIDRKAQDAALDLADAFLTDPVAARKRPEPRTPKPPLGDLRILTVRVVDPDGKSVPSAHVAATIEGAAFRARNTPGRCKQGRCELRVPKQAGFARAWQARSADGTPLPLGPSADVAFDEVQQDVVLTLPVGHALSGRVFESDRTPAVGLTLKARSAPDKIHGMRDYPLHIVHAETQTDAQGRFRLLGLRNEAYDLEIEREGKRATTASHEFDAGATDVEIRLHGTQDIRLTLLDFRDAPVKHATVRVDRFDGDVSHSALGVSGSDGKLLLEGLDPTQPHHLSIEPGDDDAQVARLELPQWQPADETIRIPRGWTLTGRIQAADGQLAEARTLVQRSPDGHPKPHATRDGTFKLRGLPYAAVEVAALPEDAPWYRFGRGVSWKWQRIEPTDQPVVVKPTELVEDSPTRTSDAAAAKAIDWTVPEGWEATPKQRFELFCLRPTGSKRVSCRCASMAGTRVTAKEVLNRWRAMLGKDELGDAALAALPHLKVLGQESPFLTASGHLRAFSEPEIEDATLLAVFCQQDGHVVTVRMTGPTTEVEAERERFIALCRSLRRR